ncbi:hypothetical protein BC751_2262 [Cecembia calidifontis]|jgi:hypothetical protein|uniref:Uncharacterized protein n=1 Tax=Cecembia calidifontis TaxID=1187080 RepID=A0A4Q7PAW1_9BACT|nr:hypothetical protein BC751_2262 [Cecembia calidifontis]
MGESSLFKLFGIIDSKLRCLGFIIPNLGIMDLKSILSLLEIANFEKRNHSLGFAIPKSDTEDL